MSTKVAQQQNNFHKILIIIKYFEKSCSYIIKQMDFNEIRKRLLISVKELNELIVSNNVDSLS